MTHIAVLVACALLAALGFFQLLLVAGAPLGRFAWGGKHAVLPTSLRIGSLISVIFYILFALIILHQADYLSITTHNAIRNSGIWILAVYFTLGAVLNALSRSKPERLAMTPVALTLALMCFIIALS